MSVQPPPAKPAIPLSSWLIPIVLLSVVAAVTVLGRATPTSPGGPLPLRTPEGTPPPGATPLPSGQPTPDTPKPAQTPEEAIATPTLPELPIYPGATMVTDSPYYLFTVEADFPTVRDWYLGDFGADAQYAETAQDSGGHKSAIIFKKGSSDAVQIKTTDTEGSLELAIGPLSSLSQRR